MRRAQFDACMRQLVKAEIRRDSTTSLDAFVVGVQGEHAGAGDLARFDHCLEVRQQIHVPAHVRRQHLPITRSL